MIVLRKKKSRKLDLSNRNLNEFPVSVFKDKKIERLDLSNNHIKDIPANIGELSCLKYLHLENNGITQLHLGILNAKSLKCLYLKGNPMKSLPDFIKEHAHFSISTDNELFSYYRAEEVIGNNPKLQDELYGEVKGIIDHDTSFTDTSVVPTVYDSDLTYPRHDDRKGKSLETCVLFVDIRDSVQKNKDHRASTLARMYSAFVYGVLRIAKEYNGHIRNIIGDRVMVVFDKDSSCDNAVRCAGVIMYFCKSQMGRTLPNDSFKCGIGIHYGNMKVIKVGLTTHDKENEDNMNLVWIGDPANLASRLTDMAGKENVPAVIISADVYKRLAESSLRHRFTTVDKNMFKDVDFTIWGCNLFIK